MEERSETVREERREQQRDSRSHVDEHARSQADHSEPDDAHRAGDFTALRERGDRKGGSTSSSG